MNNLTQIDQNQTETSMTQEDGQAHNVALKTGLKAGHYEHYEHHPHYEAHPRFERHERFDRHHHRY